MEVSHTGNPVGCHWLYRIWLPSGDHTGLLAIPKRKLLNPWPTSLTGSVLVSLVLPLPSAFMTQISPLDPSLPTSPESKAILVPSGDQSGKEFSVPQPVSRVSPVPSGWTLKMACRHPARG